jgi:predicted regulator of Ras-like GTPase activity (Roadblock/LC7/MglB family)
VSEPDDALVARLAPYRAHPGVKAALLISHDGFLVAADATADINAEAVAAQVAGIIDTGRRLAGELGAAEARYISMELESLNIVLAPFGDELMLCLIGDPTTIALTYTLRDAPR